MTQFWLITDEALSAIETARKTEVPGEFLASFAARGRRVGSYERSSSTARVAVKGPLLKAEDPLLDYFRVDYTTYGQIREAIASANSDSSVTDIELAVDSPGGMVDGLFETLAALESSAKPITAKANLAASAAYALAAKAQRIEATSPASMFGSIGVAVSMFVSPYVVDVTSTEAPNKRPDVRTEEGKAVIRAQLDEVHGLFASAIADGRNTTVERVNSEYGRGSVFLAAEALRRGMIDAASELPRRKANVTADLGGVKEKTKMDLKTLKASHPEVFAAAYEEGITAERDRVTAHLTLAEGSGDHKTAVEAIRAGTGVTATVQAAHLAASMKRSHIETRQSEADAAASALAGADRTDPTAASDEQFVAAFTKFSKEF